MAESYANLLDPLSPQYADIKFALKLALQGHPSSEVFIWEIDNPLATATFTRRCSSMLKLRCWSDCGSIGTANVMDDVCRRGFVFPPDGRGMSFHHGNIKLDSSNEKFGGIDEISHSGKQQHYYIFSDVGVGRPYIVDANASDRIKPHSYDSLYVSKLKIDANDDGVISQDEYEALTAQHGDGSGYEHEYIVTDTAQVLPRYVIRFSADVELDEALANEAAENAADPSKVYDRYDFFDPVLYQPVSLRDKMVGSHSSGEAATHKLINLSDAYNACVVESQKPEPIVSRKKKQIMDELSHIDNKLRDINLNYAQVEEDLYSLMKKSLTKLKDEVNCKNKILLSTELELRRQLEQFDNSDQWISKQHGVLSEAEFLQAWKYHSAMTSSMATNVSDETAILHNLKANLGVKGNIEIVTTTGEGLLCEMSDASNNSNNNVTGTTELRQQLFTDANTGVNTVTGSTNKNMMSPNAVGMLNYANRQSFNTATNGGNAGNHVGIGSPMGGMNFQPPNFPGNAASSGFKSADNEAWVSSLEASMGLNKNSQSRSQSQIPISPSPSNNVNYQPARVMTQVAQKFPQYSLTALADRKIRQLTAQPTEQMVFRGSNILSAKDAKTLYYSIPFISNLPSTKLVYSTKVNERSLRALQNEVVNVMAPTMIIIRSGEYVFGGYATDPWKFDGTRNGNPKSFLFSLTLDCKVPYHGRQKDAQSSVLSGSAGKRHDCQWAGSDFLSFGIQDLCLRGDFRMCSSEIEFSYSLGVAISSVESKSFLAGSSVFVADEIEVWSVAV